ncbi:unnamed protein product [marine sediment metagenome]|uniref:Uncharacterized protein n=1 Tax=marine sediment metagenome TaxID=412755 RepID=X1F246_9ZZZZ
MELKAQMRQRLQAFSQGNLHDNALALLNSLSYLVYPQSWQSATTEFRNMLRPALLWLPASIRENIRETSEP